MEKSNRESNYRIIEVLCMEIEKKILLCGLQKCGSNWVRFVIFNYFNILNNNATKTLTWNELEKPHLERFRRGIDFEGTYEDGFPNIHHTHNSYDGHGIFVQYPNYPEFFDKFDIMIYIIRNPFDTIISYWHFMMDRDLPAYPLPDDELRELKTLEGFAKFYLPKWIHHTKTTKHKANIVLDYDILQKDTSDFKRALELITDDHVNEIVYQKALEISTFENIKDMSISTGRPSGLGYPYYRGYFCRDGRSGQYKDVMSSLLINYIKYECEKEGIKVD